MQSVFSLRVREVSGSIPERAHQFLGKRMESFEISFPSPEFSMKVAMPEWLRGQT